MKSHSLFSVLLPGAMLLGMSPASAQVNNGVGTMRVESEKQGVLKGGKKEKRSEWISLTSFNMGDEAAVDARAGGSRGARTHKPIQVTKEIDAASPNLLQALNNHEIIKSVTIQLAKMASDGKPIVYRTITLKDAVVSKIRQDGQDLHDHTDATHSPREEISFDYKTIQIEDVK